MGTILLSLAAGLLTVLSPCVIPILPFIIGSSLQSGKKGPLLLVTGLATSFTLLGLSLALLQNQLNLSPDSVRLTSGGLILLLGIILLIPSLSLSVSESTSPLANWAQRQTQKFSGNTGHFVLGALLGAIWTPCTGPTLGLAFSLAASGENIIQASLIMISFSLGASLPLLGIATISQSTFRKFQKKLITTSQSAKKVLAILMIIIGISTLSQADKWIESQLLQLMPLWLENLIFSL